MARLKPHEDAYGQALASYLSGVDGYEIVERDDGNVAYSGGPTYYLGKVHQWSKHAREGIRYARGRVLDIGCGAGRVCLHLQEKGHEVVGIDVSPLALKVCRKRGVKKVEERSVTQIDRSMGTFDTIVMFGNNFGLVSNRKRAKWLLKRFHSITSDNARIIAESTDPYATKAQHHLAYHRQNRKRGRLSGELRIRVRFMTYKTPWLDYLLASKNEMADILEGTGWHIARTFGDVGYVAVIEKD